MEWNSKLMANTEWSADISNRAAKQIVAEQIAAKVNNGDIIGVGSGSTSLLALMAIAERVKNEKLNILAIPTSLEILITCSRLGVPVSDLLSHKPDWQFDGADEVDPNRNLIKGRGGAMFKEKLMIRSSTKTFIIVDESKMVKQLGEKFPVPIEVFPMSLTYTESELIKLGANTLTLRPAKGKDGPVITENGNFILDAHFDEMYPELERDIKSITGIIESGLFMGYNPEIIVPA